MYAADRAAEGVAGCDGPRIGQHGARRAAAVAGMRTDIEPGPIERRLNVRRLDGHIGCARRPSERKQAQADAGKCGSAAAVHADNSSARIPAVSFVIPGLLPARCVGRNSSPSLIASHSQLARKNMDKAVGIPSPSDAGATQTGRLGQPFAAWECCTSTVTCDKSANLANLLR